MRLGRFDLNLLPVFEAMMRAQSVKKAADELGLSQPAVSHALNRMRLALKDQLFVRTPDGMRPTPRADQLAVAVRGALSGLQAALEPELFRPETAERQFFIAVNNYAAVVLAPLIVSACAAIAPGVRFELRPSGTQGLADLFDRSELDLALIGNSLPAERFESAVLLEDRYVAVMRRGHPALGQPLTLEALGSLPHLGISSSRENLGFLDNALSAVGQSRHVTLQAPYLSAGALLTGSDRIVVLGEQLAREFSRTHAVDFAPLAIPSPAIRSVMVWHRRVSEQPAHRWLRETISQTAQRLQTGRGCVPARA